MKVHPQIEARKTPKNAFGGIALCDGVSDQGGNRLARYNFGPHYERFAPWFLFQRLPKLLPGNSRYDEPGAHVAQYWFIIATITR